MVFVHLAEGFEELEAITIVDVLRRAGIEVITVSITKDKAVTGSHNITIMADILYENANYTNCEMIVLPGGMPGTTNLAKHVGLLKYIKDFADDDKWIAAICAAPMVLGNLSILRGKYATIYPGMELHLVGAKLSSEKVVVDGKIITSKGPGTAMDFALKLVEVLKGDQIVYSLRKAMVL